MPLVNAKCTNCGATLSVDNTKDAVICQFCGSAFVVEKAINNYNISNNIKANTVNIYGAVNSDFVIRAGVLEKYTGVSDKVNIPDIVRVIGPKAFADLHYLADIVIPSSVKVIEHCAFENCKNLQFINIPNSVKKIGAFAFRNCKRIESITLPHSVTELHGVFENCDSLKNVHLSKNLRLIGNLTFAFCVNLTSISIPSNAVVENNSDTLYQGAFRYCENLRDVIYDNIEALPKKAFLGTPWLANIQRSWREQGLCDECGSQIKGIFKKECIKCGKKLR